MSPSISVRFLQTQSDERLLSAAREGHERAFEALVQRYRKPLLRYCKRLLLPTDRAEDALQQGLLQAWLSLQRGTEVREVKSWLYRVVHNAAVDALRSSGYDHDELREALRGAAAPEGDLERRVAVRQTLAGLAGLPELQREALLRAAVEGHSHEQVAAALGLSDGAVRGLVYRARATLRTALTAITPPPVFVWAASAGHRGASLSQRLGGAGTGGGVAGATGAVLKGGAAVLTAGALVAGAATVSHTVANRSHHPGSTGSTRSSRQATHAGLASASAARGPSASTDAEHQSTRTVPRSRTSATAHPLGASTAGGEEQSSPPIPVLPAAGRLSPHTPAPSAPAVGGEQQTGLLSPGPGGSSGEGSSGGGPGGPGDSGGAGDSEGPSPQSPSSDGGPGSPGTSSDSGGSSGSSGGSTTDGGGGPGPSAPEASQPNTSTPGLEPSGGPTIVEASPAGH